MATGGRKVWETHIAITHPLETRMDRFDVITRGVDSSGRSLTATRQFWQYFDRVNTDAAGGILVAVQGAFRGDAGADASANTHAKAGACDYRVWNLTESVRVAVRRRGRELGGLQMYRTEAQGFDPHIHDVLIGDAPMHPETAWQVTEYKAGRNGLVSRGLDDFWRPAVIKPYEFLPEDDMFEPEDRDRLKRIEEALHQDKTRDQHEAERDKKRFERIITQRGNDLDALTLLINKTSGDVQADLKQMKRKILADLKDDPDVTGKDNPSDEAMAEAGL